MRGNRKLAKVFGEPQRRTAWFAMRLMPGEKDSIRAAARTVGRTMSAYLLGLHRHYTGGRKGVRK